MRHAKLIRGLAMAALLLIQAGAVIAAPEIGWWWNPAESGRGFFIESHDGIFFMAAYTYADDGRALWLVSGGDNADPYNYSGPLLTVNNGQTLFGPYVPPGAPATAGAITVSFSDDTHGTIVWPGGMVPIVREIFDTTVAPFQPQSGWWWNPDESGSGYSIEVEGGTLFMVGFMYDAAGNPVWYLSAGPMKTPTTYSGSLVQVANGQTVTGPYHPPSPPTTIGTVSIEFTSTETASIAFTDDGATTQQVSPRAGRSRMFNLKTQFKHPKPPPFAFPSRLDGNFTQNDSLTMTTYTGGTLTIKSTITGHVIWLPSELGCPVIGASTCQPYDPSGGSLHVKVEYSDTEPEPTFSCTGTSDDHDFDMPTSDLSYIQINSNSTYSLKIVVPDGLIDFVMNLDCSIQGTPFTGKYYVQKDVELPVRAVARGTITYGVNGSMPQTTVSGLLLRSGSWSFAAIK